MPDEQHEGRETCVRTGGPVGHAVTVVGIGASAGGLEALTVLFDAMPADTGLAFLVVMHLDPARESQIAAILGQHTAMPAIQIEDGMEIAPDRVYVIAPNRYLTLEGTRLRLVEPPHARRNRHPVDALFSALAEQRGERTIAIILSGTGTNGVQGLKEIKAAGGLVLIQDPATARFDGMPQSAIRAGLADHVLAPGAMPQTLQRYLQHGYIKTPERIDAGAPGEPADLTHVIGLLRAQTGYGFQNYKPGMLLRRVHRRMSVRGLDSLDSYLALLREDQAETKALARDMLISVTSFFRDDEAWAELDRTVITPLIANRETGAAIRVWVPACASGEEAYSLAILMAERAESAGKQFDLKIFASDVLDENLNAAREGVYPAASVDTLPSTRIRRFFERLDGSYQVRKELRDLIVFARQDVLRDPPFSRMDLISCRNLLIYVKPDVQKRAVALFHFALRESGHLFLGNAETIGNADDLFETVSKKWRIYRRIGATRHDIVEFPLTGAAPPPPYPMATPASLPEISTRVTEVARRALLDRYAPASVLIDQKGRILYFHGDTGGYLAQPSGEPTRDLLAMAREGLLTNLRRAIQSVGSSKESTSFAARVRHGDEVRAVRVTLSPLPVTQQATGLMLVSFEPEPEQSPPPAPINEPAGQEAQAAATALEEELKATRAELQSTIGQLEGANEEMKAANEEATSMNEELQSTNEELETSKEELQSFNEELHTVNNQLQHKIRELEDTGNDMANLLAGTETATVFLDTEFRLKWFSPATEQVFQFLVSDIGRPISHFAPKFSDDRLLSDADTVLSQLTRIEAEVQSDAGRWFLRRIMPYRTRDNRIAGLVLTFTDITDGRRAREMTDEARIYAEAIIGTTRQPLIVLDAGMRVRSANAAFYRLFDTSPEQTEQRRLYDLADGIWDIPELRRLLEEVLPEDSQFQDVEFAFGPREPGRRTALINGRRLARNGSGEELILLAVEEITERKRADERQEILIRELSHRVKNVLATVQAIMTLTSRQNLSMDAFRMAFEGRLQALSQAHNLLVEKDWAGTDIERLVTQTLQPYRTGTGTRITVHGPTVTLRPQAGVALVMILHELATNAAKYGALSVPTGKLEVRWHRDADDDRVHLRWHESGGPAVTPPKRRGFGTKLIPLSTAHELGGEAHLEFPPEGLCCELIFPLIPPEPAPTSGR
jgi:two-component system CheB/CheR fusion protein